MVGRRRDRELVASASEAERARWMAAAQQGDAAAYDLLLTTLLPPLRAFVRRRGVATDEVEDVVQEILLLIHRARHTWRADRPFDPWMWAVARNASTDALRRQTRERARRDHTTDPFDAGPPATEPLAGDGTGNGADPETQLTARELTPALAAALSRLPASQRQAVELLYLEQLPVAEAAARAGVSPSALKVRAHRGSRALRAALRAERSP
jgi:RNA polymerase sigma-70 factor (ECF subfamily)